MVNDSITQLSVMKATIKITCILLPVLLFLTCKSPDNSFYQFDPRTLKENKFTLSEIADEVTYVPLENSFPLGVIFNIKFINNTIYFSSKDVGILAFDREGKTLRKIGVVGRGPGEYLYKNSFTVDEKTETVYILDRGDIIKVFSRTGQYVRSFPLQECGVNEAIEFYNSKLFVSYAIQFENARYKWIVFDTLGNVIKKKEREIPMFTANYGNIETIYKFENRIFYWNNFTDTVFSVLPDLRKEPSFIISPGEHRPPRSKLTIEQLMQNKFLNLFKIFETSRFFVIRYFYNKPTLALIDKHNQESFLIYLEYENENCLNGIENDIDGGQFFIPESNFTEKGREYLVGVINPYQIKTHIEGPEFKKSAPKYPEKKKELEKLANSLKETDNPVLMLVILKK
jgi:hypothetical protein